jgi:CRISPR-associated endonuclease/helicase Cas3
VRSLFSKEHYREFFMWLTDFSPFDYQTDVADLLFRGNNVVLRAPTGAGKTWAVLTPFLCPEWGQRPSRLIYALPLRTLAQNVYRQARQAAQKLGKAIAPVLDEHGREKIPPFVTLQTGEQPDDRFFDRGRIIVTTYDQVLSGLLEGPYGLSSRLHNVNAAAVAGALVVFDEFHLMPAQRAFLTAVAGLKLFDKLCQSVWMTATATSPLENLLHDVLNTSSVPATPEESQRLYASLPSVRDVQRKLLMEDLPLTPGSVLKFSDTRSIVLTNTVARAQAIFRELGDALAGKGAKIPLLLLHSRFFKGDRQAKERRLQLLFGPGTSAPAILVATQVVEAGVDISCEHLHTELCPMNSLVQRSGRCARFPGESGTVHVYPLPAAPRNWLPYGDTAMEDPALSRTRDLLREFPSASVHPDVVAQWVEAVHADDDLRAVEGRWQQRSNECLARIHQTAVLRQPQGIAHLIRGDDTDSVRVIVARAGNLPETPAEREGVSFTRWSLARILDGSTRVGAFWDGSDEAPWKPLRNIDDLRRTYAICLNPAVARYTEAAGLELGLVGSIESPPRQRIRGPGYAPLHAETWLHHARCVAEETQRRMDRECPRDGFLSSQFAARYGLEREGLLEAMWICAILHDLGKLQDGWQRWAEAAMRAARPSYVYESPLAHTEFDPSERRDRQRENEISKTTPRPAHAPASAFYGRAIIAQLITQIPEEIRAEVASACLAAVLAHHGGWLPDNRGPGLGIQKLVRGWEPLLAELLGTHLDTERFVRLSREADRRGRLSKFFSATLGPDELGQWWPLVSYLTRTLRLSDQRATAESHNHE